MTYFALLRGINVGGHNKVKMADLRDALTASGLENVKTYIQSGNIYLESSLNTAQDVAKAIQQVIQENFDLNIKVVVKTPTEIAQATKKIPQEILESLPHNKVFLMFLDESPEENAISNFLSRDYSPDWLSVSKNIVCFACPDGISKSKLNNNWIERQLRVRGTTRNYKTLLKMLSLAE